MDLMNVLRTGMDMSISHIRIMGMLQEHHTQIFSDNFCCYREGKCCVFVRVLVTCFWRGDILLLLSEEEL